MTRSWKLEQATFTIAEATQITGVQPGSRRKYRRWGLLPKTKAAFGEVTLREVVWLLTLARTARVHSLAVAATYIGPAVDYALSYLALKNMPFPFVGTTEEQVSFQRWCTNEARARAWVHRQLDIASGDLHRFTAFHPHEGSVQVDKLSELDTKMPALVKFVVSGSAIANRVSLALPKPPFVAMAAA